MPSTVVSSSPEGAPTRPPGWFLALLVGMSLLWFVYLGWLSWQRWQAGDIGIDTAAWAQALHEHKAGNGFRFTCYLDADQTMARSMFSIHFYLHLPLVRLFYGLAPHPLSLYVMQHLCVVLGAIFLGLLAWRASSGDGVWALCLAGAFLLYAPLARAQVAYDVNPRHAAMLLLPLAGWARSAGHWNLVLAALLMLGAGEENLSMMAGFTLVGLAWPTPKLRRWALAWGGGFLIYTVLVLRFGLPGFMTEGFQVHFLGRYALLGQGVSGWLAALFRWENGAYLLELLGPLALLPLLSLGSWHVAALPFLGQNLLSGPLDTRLIGHHYTSPLAVVIFLTVVEGCAHHRWRRFLAVGVFGLNLALAIVWSPVLSFLWEGLDARVIQVGNNMAPIAGVIPADAALSAPPAVCARFWARPRLWFFPQGLDEAEVVVIPCYDPGYPALSAADLRGYLARLRADPRVTLVLQNDDFLVFHRRPVPTEAPGNN
jgi:uncharacterized membrane protein